MRKIKKAVIAAAGYGTRFLPATKVQPKEMLPIVDKPIIQYLVEEAVASGIEDIIIVTRAGNQALEDHFDSSIELENYLQNQEKLDKLEETRKIPNLANFVYVRQKRNYPYGNATPLLCVKNLIDDDEAFVYMFGDDLIKSKVPGVLQLIKVREKNPAAFVSAFQEVPLSEVNRYGIAKLKSGTKDNELEYIVEKPDIDKAPSNFAQDGRFILDYRIYWILENLKTGIGNELWLADALREAAKQFKVLAHPVEGSWVTTGDPLRYMQAAVKYSLDREDIGEEFREYLRSLEL